MRGRAGREARSRNEEELKVDGCAGYVSVSHVTSSRCIIIQDRQQTNKHNSIVCSSLRILPVRFAY